MKTYGEVFHYLRTNKGMKLKELADEQLSISLIAQFEKNQSKLSFDRFIRLMNKLEVSYDEIQALLEQSTLEKNYEDILITDYQTTTNSNFGYDKKLFSQLYQQLSQKSQEILTYLQKHPSLRLEHFYQFTLVTNQFWYELSQSSNNLTLAYCQSKVKDYLTPIIQYLLSVDNWGVYEISLMNRFALAMPIDLLMKLMTQATKRAKNYLHLPGNKELIFKVFFTCFSVALNLGAYHEAKVILQNIRKNLENDPNEHYALRALFYEAMLHLHLGHDEQGEKLFNQVIQTCLLLKMPKTAQAMIEERKTIEYVKESGAFVVHIYI